MKEIVIKIHDDIHYSLATPNVAITFETISILIDAICNGTELPKGHKELIDTKELIQGFVTAEENMKGNGVTPVFDVHEITNMILSQNVIVEADKGDEE